MIDHDEARMLASARSDGELDAARFGELDEHLASCDACRAFAEALPQLSVLAAALPREHAPAELSRRVRAGLVAAPVAPARRRAMRWRVAPALAAAVVVAIVAVMIGSVPIITVPPAEAARALSRLRSLSVEREIIMYADDGTVTDTIRERTWFRAPGTVRTEATTDGVTVVTIEGPGFRYREDRNGRFLNTNLLPSAAALPEPLTPVLSLLGDDAGPGPTVLGRETRRISLAFGGERREVLMDAESFTVLGATELVAVVGKERFEDGRLRTTKRTLALEYNPTLDDALFTVPDDATVIDNGAQARPLGSLSAPPAGRLENLALVAAAAGAGGEAILYAQGAFQILVEIDGPTSMPSLARVQSALIGERRGTLILPLYGLPEVRFTAYGHRIAIRAPLPPAELRELAARMYPGRE